MRRFAAIFWLVVMAMWAILLIARFIKTGEMDSGMTAAVLACYALAEINSERIER